MRLYLDTFWTSPYSLSAFVALTEKGVQFETQDIPLHEGGSDEPSYRARSVTGRIPALQDGDFWLAESSAIIDYLEDIVPFPRLLPADPQDRAKARMVLAWIRSSRDLLPLIEERSSETLFYRRDIRPLTWQAAESADKLIEVADQLLPPGATQLFHDWSIADTDLAFCLNRLSHNKERLSPKLEKFVQTQWARPSVQAFVRHPRPSYVPY